MLTYMLLVTLVACTGASSTGIERDAQDTDIDNAEREMLGEWLACGAP